MEFQTEPQEKCYEKAKGYMKEVFGEQFVSSDNEPMFLLPHGTAALHVVISPWSDDDATILMRAYVARGPRLDEELFSYLLHKNDNMRFGAFGLDNDNDIFFEHTIVGVTCDKEEFKASALAVVSTADSLDEEITEKWGGKKAMDAMLDMPTPPEPAPEPEKKKDGFSVLEEIDKGDDGEKETTGGKRRCPRCKKEYAAGTRWCKFDGSELEDI